MTPDNRTPRKRRRRRRRGQGGPAGSPPGANGSSNGSPSPGNEAVPQHRDGESHFGGGGGAGQQRRRRRRSRQRGGPGGGDRYERSAEPYVPPTDIAPGELTEVSGVLHIKPNGVGILVNAANNYVPQPG